MLYTRLLIGGLGLLICNSLIKFSLVPSSVTLCAMVFAVFIISFCFRVFYRIFLNLWGHSFCFLIYIIILVSAAIVISYGRIELNAHLTTCFLKLLGTGILIMGPTDILITRMMPNGSENSANSGSGNWQDFLNFSPEQGAGDEVNQPVAANPPQAAANPAVVAANPPVVYENNMGEPPNSHYWHLRRFGFDYIQTMNTPDSTHASSSLPSIEGDSWIEESYGNRRGEGATSSAPVQQQQEAGQPAANPIPSNAAPQAAREVEVLVIPSPEISQGELLGEGEAQAPVPEVPTRGALEEWLERINKRVSTALKPQRVKRTFVNWVVTELELEDAPPEKLQKIQELMDSMDPELEGATDLQSSVSNAGNRLVRLIKNWLDQ